MTASSGNGWAPGAGGRRRRRCGRAPPEQPHPSFAVRGARVPRLAVAPTLIFDLEVDEPSARQVFTIALAVQIAIEPAQRRYDEETRERLTELLGEPGRIGSPTRTMPWAQVDVLVQPFTGTTTVAVPVLCNYDLEVAADQLLPLDRRRRGAAGLPLQRQRLLPGRRTGRLQIVQISWEESCDYRMPIAVWQEMIAAHYPHRGWIPAGGGDDRAAAPLQARAGPARPTRRRWRGCSSRA